MRSALFIQLLFLIKVNSSKDNNCENLSDHRFGLALEVRQQNRYNQKPIFYYSYYILYKSKIKNYYTYKMEQ